MYSQKITIIVCCSIGLITYFSDDATLIWQVDSDYSLCNLLKSMPSTPLRKPISVSPTIMYDEKPHKKLIRRTLSYKQIRRSMPEAEFVIDNNLNSLKPLSNSAKNLRYISHNDELKVPKNEQKFSSSLTKKPKENKKPQRPMSLDLDAVARVLNANWTDDFKVALFHPTNEDFMNVSESADSDSKKSDKLNGATGFKKSFKKKNLRKLTLHSITPTSADSLKSPSIGGYIRDSWDSLLTKVTERHSSDLRKYELTSFNFVH